MNMNRNPKPQNTKELIKHICYSCDRTCSEAKRKRGFGCSIMKAHLDDPAGWFKTWKQQVAIPQKYYESTAWRDHEKLQAHK